jgi:lysophospholipase L1-like esterase
MSKIINKSIKEVGKDNVYILEITSVNEEVQDDFKNNRIKQFNKIIKDISVNKKINFIKTFNKINNGDLIDGYHLNTTGHKKIFEIVKNSIW